MTYSIEEEQTEELRKQILNSGRFDKKDQIVKLDDPRFKPVFKVFSELQNNAVLIFKPFIWAGYDSWVVYLDRWCIDGSVFEKLKTVGFEVTRVDSKSGACWNNYKAGSDFHHLELVISGCCSK